MHLCLHEGGKGWGRCSATGSHEIRRDLSAWAACVGPASAPPENRCTYSLHFNSQKQAFCSSRLPKLDFDLSKIPFPDGACNAYALGAREKNSTPSTSTLMSVLRSNVEAADEAIGGSYLYGPA